MTMRHAARPPARHPPNPSLAPASRPTPPPPPATPAARRPFTPLRAAQDVSCATSIDGSEHSARGQGKQHPSSSSKNHPDSADKLKMPRSSGSGGTYSKPDARVKLIPVEDITYVQHRKPYGRTVGSAGSQKRQCRRSVTPPPNSRRVSLVGSTSLAQNPMPPASINGSRLSSKRLETAENRRPPTPRNLDRMDGTKALARSSSSSILHSQDQSSQKLSVSLPKEAVINPVSPSSKQTASLPKEAVINPVSPSPKQMRALHPSDNPIGTKAGPSKSAFTSESGELCGRSIYLTTRSTAVPVLQDPVVDPALLSPTSVLSGRPIEVYLDTRTAAPVTQEPTLKPVSPSPIAEHTESSTQCKSIPPSHHRPQSMASAQHAALSQEINSGASINCGKSLGAPVILHTKLHKKHYQSEAPWKGNFHVTGELVHTCDGLEAHFPFEICVRAYEASKQMPETLNLEAVPLSQLWPKMFRMAPPDGQDLGLWFVSSHQSQHNSFDHLLEKVASHTGLWTKIGGTELAIFSSKLLTQHYQKRYDKLYFWGVFGKRLRKKRCQQNSLIKTVKIGTTIQSNEETRNKCEEVAINLDASKIKETENAESDIGITLAARGDNTTDVSANKGIVRDNYKGIARELDLTGGNTEKVNDSMSMLGAPNTNPASSCSAPAAALLNGRCSHDSAYKRTFSLEDSACQPTNRSSASSDIMDIPPGFSLDAPPGFSKANSQLQIGAAAVSYADVPPSLNLDTPPGFPTDIHTDSTCQPADRSSARSNIMLDIHPRFSLDVPPGFTKANCQLQIGATAVSYANAPASLILDTPPGFPMNIPPGFNESHRKLPPVISPVGPGTCVSTPDTEKKPIIRFSINVPKPKMEVPPGFNALHAAKKEPALPNIDKAMEKQTSAAFAMGKPVKADEMKIMNNQVKVEDDSSEERGCPKTKQLSDLYPSPSDSTEISQPTSACLPDFQERAPRKQVHQRKRDRQEPAEPSPADTKTKRPNVNGRIALNNSSGHGNDMVRCACASSKGRTLLPMKGPVEASSGDPSSESNSCRCLVCGEEFTSDV